MATLKFYTRVILGANVRALQSVLVSEEMVNINNVYAATVELVVSL